MPAVERAGQAGARACVLGEVVLDTLDAQGLSGCERERLARWSQKEEETGRGESSEEATGRDRNIHRSEEIAVEKEPKDRGVSPQRALPSPHLGLSQEDYPPLSFKLLEFRVTPIFSVFSPRTHERVSVPVCAALYCLTDPHPFPSNTPKAKVPLRPREVLRNHSLGW